MADAPIDPEEYDIPELGPAVQEIESVADLEAILRVEEEGADREAAKQLLESRIEKFREEDIAAEDAGFDLTEYSPAEIGNELQDIEDPERLEDLLERERAGEDRDAVVTLVQNRLDSVQGADEEAIEAAEESEPEEEDDDLDHPTADKQYVSALEDGTYRDMWVYCETQAGGLIDVSKEMLGKARDMMDGYAETYGGEEERVVAVVIGDEVADLAAETIEYGADVALYAEDPRLERFRHRPYAELFAAMARENADADWRDYDEPRYVLFPATNNGRDLSAQVQAELDSGLASDCSGLYIEDTVISNPAKTGGTDREFQRVLHMKRPDFSGFEYSTILCLDNPSREFHPQGASVIPGSFPIPEPDAEREGDLREFDAALAEDWFHVEVTEHDRLEEGIDLAGHDVVVALGRGIGDDPTRGIELGLDLVDALDDAALGLSRGVVTASYSVESHVEEYVTEERQIGETGQVVEPDVYVAAGISGAVQHKVGMDESETIVAVNTDPEARIRDFSDYFVEGDLFEVLPQLTEALESGEPDIAAAADGGGGDD
jgi:electron transfer flavoprotein alpha subunit